MVTLGIIVAIILMLILGLITYLITIYNGLVTLKNNIDKAWSNIDVLLKQRYDELPKLVEVCRGYMQHERETLEAVIQARSALNTAGGQKEQMAAENMLSGALKSLFAVSENYPQLKADASFRQLQGRITDIENSIADRREFYNESVNLHNIRIEQFPDVLIAKNFGYSPRTMWQIDEQSRNDVEISFA